MDAMKVARQHVAIDMTPMIDCVFLLMIFFVLIIDLSQQNLEDLVLPRAPLFKVRRYSRSFRSTKSTESPACRIDLSTSSASLIR